MRGKRFLCALFAFVLLCSLVPETGRAAPTVYFTSVNDQLLPDLSDATMPFWSNGRLYVPYTAVSGTDLGVFYSRSRDKKTAVVYRQGNALTFDLSAGTVADQNGTAYGSPALVRSDVVFLPVELLAEFFSLDYSYTRVTYGYLVRLKSDTVVLSDAKFIDAAAAGMEQRYNDYIKARGGDYESNDTPYSGTDDSFERAYLAVTVTDAPSCAALLDTLKSADGKATFLFPEKQLTGSDDLLRRLLTSGSAVALSVDGSGGAARALSSIERANDALWTACNAKTRLVYLSDASEATLLAIERAGYCPIVFDLDYSADAPSAYQMGSTIASRARSGGCSAYLGSDLAVSESWSTLLARLRAALCPISQLNELSAHRES